jgi:ubiquinone/menaquinone biosynthesis C-methylase UbiE
MEMTEEQKRMYRISFGFIKFMHDNALLRRLIDPGELLKRIGIKDGDVVFEIGCGPGFYTIGATEAVGPRGKVFAYDVNPYACEYLSNKLANRQVANVEVENRNATESGLSDKSVDFAFLTGVPHIVGGLEALLKEIKRVLKRGAVLAIRPSRNNAKEITVYVERFGLSFRSTKDSFLLFSST